VAVRPEPTAFDLVGTRWVHDEGEHDQLGKGRGMSIATRTWGVAADLPWVTADQRWAASNLARTGPDTQRLRERAPAGRVGSALGPGHFVTTLATARATEALPTPHVQPSRSSGGSRCSYRISLSPCRLGGTSRTDGWFDGRPPTLTGERRWLPRVPPRSSSRCPFQPLPPEGRGRSRSPYGQDRADTAEVGIHELAL
jgi:hypothetical protein